MVKSYTQITDVDVEKLSEDIQSEQAIVDELARLIDAECKYNGHKALPSDKHVIDLRKINDDVKLVSNEARTHETALRQALLDLDIPRIHDQLSELTKNLESLHTHFFLSPKFR
jgi:hypothetical protein